MDERLDEISAKLDRLLAILDAKEHKKLQDRERIKSKRDDDAAEAAKRRGVIVVDRLTGTFARDDRLPYKKWAYICLEFQDALNFMRWMVNEYLTSYYCLQDGRKRMIARNGNYWKVYKSCGTELLLTPADMFGGVHIKWDDMLDVQMLKWCFKHIRPVLAHLVNEDRLEYVHEKRLPWDDEKVNDHCGHPLPLESRWWRKSTRFRETVQASFAPYSRSYLRTSKGTVLLDNLQDVLERPEAQCLYKGIYNALREGVMNRGTPDEWMGKRRLKEHVERGTRAWRDGRKIAVAKDFMVKLKRENALRLGMELASRAKEEQDLQIAIEQSIQENLPKTSRP